MAGHVLWCALCRERASIYEHTDYDYSQFMHTLANVSYHLLADIGSGFVFDLRKCGKLGIGLSFGGV
jgi:hypothetical protein